MTELADALVVHRNDPGSSHQRFLREYSPDRPGFLSGLEGLSVPCVVSYRHTAGCPRIS